MKKTFSKHERLSSKKLIKELFEKGSSFYIYPFKVIYLTLPTSIIPTNQVLFSVSKRNFKKAVDRNRIKRLMREGFRLNKHLISNKISDTFHLIAYIYTSKEILSFKEVEDKLKISLQRFSTNSV